MVYSMSKSRDEVVQVGSIHLRIVLIAIGEQQHRGTFGGT
jgi:hypothetical protein